MGGGEREAEREGERKEEGKERERSAWRSNPLEIVIGTSGGTSDRWKIQPPLISI